MRATNTDKKMSISYTKRYGKENADGFNFFGSLLLGMKFHDRGAKMIFDIDGAFGEISEIRMVCLDPSNYKSEINSADPYNTISGLHITGFSYKKEMGRYSIQIFIDVEAQGFIKLNCSDFYFEEPVSEEETTETNEPAIF